MKISFELIAGVLYRNSVRQELQNSKTKLEYWYPGCRVLLTENKGFLETSFHFEATDLPESAEPVLLHWKKKIEQIVG